MLTVNRKEILRYVLIEGLFRMPVCGIDHECFTGLSIVLTTQLHLRNQSLRL